jgi:4-hydroxy-tetrahydrodipicolinate synthase
MFAGLSAFPLTPLAEEGIDEASYARLVVRLADAGVDSIGALGSTGSYAYFSRAERARAAIVAVENAGSVPVIVGVGALRTRDVLANVEDAQNAGAAGVLLAPMTYQALTDDEVYGLYEHVAANLSVPLVVYDNPSTTHVHFSDELHGRIAQLSAVAAIKIPPVITNLKDATARVDSLRAIIPPRVGLGISGDGFAINGLLAGCDSWYSVLAGLLPRECLAMTTAAIAGDGEHARELSDQLSPIFQLFSQYGSYRVVAAVAEELSLIGAGALPHPVRGLDAQGRHAVRSAIDAARPYIGSVP